MKQPIHCAKCNKEVGYQLPTGRWYKETVSIRQAEREEDDVIYCLECNRTVR